MRLLTYDLETTGFDTAKDRITELGAVLWDWDRKKPLLFFSKFLYESDYPPLSDEVKRVTGIEDLDLVEFGEHPAKILNMFEAFVDAGKPDFIVGHNIINFDDPMLYSNLVRSKVEAPLIRAKARIDTRCDLPHETPPDSMKLKHLLGDHGIINHCAHRAIGDAWNTGLLLARYDIEKVITYSKIPTITVRAVVSFADKDKAKARRYSWEKLGEEVYPKCWVKKIKMNELEKETEEAKKAGFQVVQLEVRKNA